MFFFRRGIDKNSCQMLLFSATYDRRVMDFAKSIITNPVVIRLKREEESLNNIRQVRIFSVQCDELFFM